MGSNYSVSPLNGPIHGEVKIMKHVMTSAAEVEIAALFVNTKLLIPLCTTLLELGHQQTPSPIQTDNEVVQGFVSQTIKQNDQKQ